MVSHLGDPVISFRQGLGVSPGCALRCGSSASTAVITGVSRHTQRTECRRPQSVEQWPPLDSCMTLQTHCPHLCTPFDLQPLPTPQGAVLGGRLAGGGVTQLPLGCLQSVPGGRLEGRKRKMWGCLFPVCHTQVGSGLALGILSLGRLVAFQWHPGSRAPRHVGYPCTMSVPLLNQSWARVAAD